MTDDPLFRVEHFAEVSTHWAAERPNTLAFRFLTESAGEGPTLDYAQLDASARRIAAAMVERAGPGERALLIYPPGLEFIEAFMACVYAGITAVPVYPPTPGQLDSTLPRLQAIARDADARLALSTRTIADVLRPLVAPSGALSWIATDEVDEGSLDRVRLAGNAPVVLQYTSGSTGDPKGVIVSHANLLHDQRAIRTAFGHDQPTSGVSWLPTYHDMGLMGKVLQTIYLGTTTSLLSPLAFIKQPVRWLEAISRHRATTSGGPDFAYALCTRRVSEAELATLDLSSWRVAFCGAEPIRMATLDAFADKFAACGFRRESLFPCYGLAESTLMVSGGWLGQQATPMTLRREALERKRAVVAAPGTSSATTVVGCGPLASDMSIAIVDPERRERVGAGDLGEIWVKGPSVAQGYWRDEARTVETFRAVLADGSGPWLRTGDVGFVNGEQLYVTGRSKEMLVVHGRNVYPQDIEATVAGCHAAIRAGGVAAFAIDHGGQDHAALVVELGRSEDAFAVELAIRRAVSTQHGVAIARLAIVPPRTLPKTSSGKLQRTLVRERLLAGAYDRAVDAEAGHGSLALYDAPNEYFRKIESRNTHYRFDIELDVAWARAAEPGVYFTSAVVGQGGIDLDAMASVPGLVDEFQWALAVAICEEFVALELRILRFLREEQTAGRLPNSRSAALFDTEEIKHVQLFRRYADELQAARPERAAELDHHLQAAFAGAWWHDDRIDRYPDPAVYHFVNWLHFVFFEEYSIYLHTAMAGDPSVQPAWISAHAAHMREERQHVVTDAAHLDRLVLDPERRREWSKWFLERSSRDASGLAGLEGVWTYLQARFPALASVSQPGALLANVELRKRAFLRLLTRENGFGHTLAAATGFDEFVRELESMPIIEASVDEAPASERELELRSQLVALLADALSMDAANVDIDQPLLYFGLDSVQAVQIAGALERAAGVELPPTLLFEHPDVRALARAIATMESTGSVAGLHVVVQHRAPTLDLDLDDLDDVESCERPRHVLLTGATGFLCSHLLAELLEHGDDRIHCLVRAPSETAGRERLRASLVQYGLWRSEFESRIDVVLGDLAAPRLGLTREAFVALAHDTDEIFHGGALVDFIQPYERLEAVNVGGTHELIRLAVRGNIPFNLISTIGIFDTRSQSGARVGERDVPDEAAGFRNGYGRSKWAAEQLVSQARARGLPVRVFRPGIVSGSTLTGAWQPDMVATLIKSFVESGIAIEPNADGCLDAAPVDYVARAIVAIAARGDGFGQVFHLDNPRPTPWRAIYAALAELGHPLRLSSYGEWLSALAGERAQPALAPFLAYFKTRDEIWKLRQPIVDCTQTLAALVGSEIECPVIDARLLRRYLDYFERVGFIRTTRQAAAS